MTAAPVDPAPRVLLAKSFIDSHDRAIKTIAMALRDAAMEVVLIDYEVPDDVVVAAAEEDAEAVGLSFMSGGQVATTRDVVAGLAASGLGDVPVVVGGTIRPFDVPELEGSGIRALFRGGEALESVTRTFRGLVDDRRAARRR